MKSDTTKPTADVTHAVAPNPRREYTVKLPIVDAGVDKVAGDQVNLTDPEAENLRASGHIE